MKHDDNVYVPVEFRQVNGQRVKCLKYFLKVIR